MIRLLRLLRLRSDALEADLIERGLDLLDYWRGTLSLRRLLVVYRWLPEGSAVRRWEAGFHPGHPGWTVAHDIADRQRRDALGISGNEDTGPHWASPEGAAIAEAEQRKVAARAQTRDRVMAEKAERERRIASGDIT